MTEKTAITQPAQTHDVRGTISVSEIFGPTVQGEGAVIGKPTVFVRTGGCDYRCSWCDSKFAVLPEFRDTWRRMSSEAVLAKVKDLSPRPILITLSGGNPALQPFRPLIQLAKTEGYRFTIETQGTLARD
jgi:7-carboxy-7-deazaguanine synthase